MKGPVKAIVLVVAALVLGGGAFWGGMAYQEAQGPVGFPAAAAQGVRGGPFADMSEEERAALEDMTDEERLEWMEENGGAIPGAGQPGPMRGGTLEGEVIEVADDTITISIAEGGSQTFYTDEDTVFAYVAGAGELAAGSSVMIVAAPAADAVTTASLVVVQ